MLFFLAHGYVLAPAADISSSCSRAFQSGIMVNSQCIHAFPSETTLDFEGQLINVLSAPLDEASCARFLYRLDNVTVKNVWFSMKATVEHSWACKKQVFGVFDTMGVKNFKMQNVSISGDVFLEKGVEASVGGVFAYQGMVLPSLSSTSIQVVQGRTQSSDNLQLVIHTANSTLSSCFNQVSYQINVYKLTKRFYGIPVVNREYIGSDYVSMSQELTNKVVFTDNELTDEGFAYNYLKFEDAPPFKDFQLNHQAGFTIYKGTVNEFLPLTRQSIATRPEDLNIPGLDTLLPVANGYNISAAARCIDAQRYALGRRYNFTGIDYEIMGNIACQGCDCVVCAGLLVAKPDFSKVYCAATCPNGSYEFDDACVSVCPSGFNPNENNTCIPLLCPRGSHFEVSSGSCIDTGLSPDLVFVGVHGELLKRDEDTQFLRQCPYHLNSQCFLSCPPGYQNIEDPFGASFKSTECINCWDLGYHGWKDGKCSSACPVDMVSENGVCVDHCSAGFFDSGYFCLRRCRGGFAYEDKCVDECPSDFLIGRDYRGCFHSCPFNMHQQGGVCVMTCDYGMQYNADSMRCEPCAYPNFAWDGTKCTSTGSHDCPYQRFEDGIYECVQGCSYGQIQNGTSCVTIDTSQGDFVDFDACPFLSKADIWGHQFYCGLTERLADRMVTVLAIHEVSDCNYAVIDLAGGSISNSQFYINTTMQIPDQCVDQVNISFFVNANSLQDVKIFGNLTVNGIQSTKANIGVAIAGNITGVLAHLNVVVSGQQYVLRTHAGIPSVPAPFFEDIESLTASMVEIERGGVSSKIFVKKEGFDLAKTLKILEFFDDMDNSTVLVKQTGGTTFYITSSVQPKLLTSNYSIIDCDIGSIVQCDSVQCTCTSTVLAFIYGVLTVNSCPEGTYPLQGKCYDECPPGYGEQHGVCELCSFYSFNGLCVESCPGSTFGKQCYVGSLKPGYVQLGQSIVKCGQLGTSPYYESGMCVEKCSSSTVNSNEICLSKCPYGSYIQYRESSGQAECVMQCDYGFYAEDFVCVRNCSDARFRQYKECRYDCSEVAFHELCVSNDCDIGFTSVDQKGVCVSCASLQPDRLMYYLIGDRTCSDVCDGNAVYINGIAICCKEGDDFDFCNQYVLNDGMRMDGGLYDGLPEMELCQVMRISNIWDTQYCDITTDSQVLVQDQIYNIIGLQLTQRTLPSGQVECRYFAMDIDSSTIINVFINVDAFIDVPEQCDNIIIGVFGTVINSQLTQITVQGKIELLNKQATQTVSRYNIISTVDSPFVKLYAELQIDNVFTTDNAGGQPYVNPSGQEANTIKYRLGDYFHSIVYVGDESESLLVQYYKALQYFYETHGLLQYNNLYQSIRPLGWNGIDIVSCTKNQVIGESSKECSDQCGGSQKLLGFACVDSETTRLKQGMNVNQYYLQCPDGTYYDVTGICMPCPLNKYIEQGQCVDTCSDGMLLLERICVVACPANYRQNGQFCQLSGQEDQPSSDNFFLSEGVLLSKCPQGFAAVDDQCVLQCAPGEFIKEGQCSTTCPSDYYVIEGECKKQPEHQNSSMICPADYFLFIDLENIFRCVKSCPNNQWAVNGLCTDDATCDDPMSYKSEISKRCIPCYVKNSPSETDKCQACTSINRTSETNLTLQYCTTCNFFYIADTQVGIETKFCTDTCPPNPKFLTEEENKKYSALRFPFSTGVGDDKQIECRESCGPNYYSHELTQTYQCSLECSGGYKSVIEEGNKTLYKRCIKACGDYPNENAVLPSYQRSDTICRNECQVPGARDGYFYRVKDENNTQKCEKQCPDTHLYQSFIGKDVLCGQSCEANHYAIPYVEQGRFSHFLCQEACSSTDPVISAYTFINEVNNSCVTGCADSPIYGNVYLSGNRCVKSCQFYKEYRSDAGSLHSMQYECSQPCNRYYVDPYGRKVCVESCPPQLKYIERDSDKRLVCVPHCSDEQMFIANGICGTTCPDVYFRTEISYDDGKQFLNRICILQQQCQPPLATETVVTPIGRMTHCTYCNNGTLTNSSFTAGGVCVQQCEQKYDQDNNCIQACGQNTTNKAFYGEDPSDPKRCIKNCFRNSNDQNKCNQDNNCTKFVTEADPYVCIENCSGFTQYKTLSGGVEVKMCVATCDMPESNTSKLCIPECGQTDYSSYPYYKKGYGCVADCYIAGEYNPVKDVGGRVSCSSNQMCMEGATTSSTKNSSSLSGMCTANTSCDSYYIQIPGHSVHRCVKSCPLLPATIPAGKEILCNTQLPGNNYIHFNYEHNAYQILGTTCSSAYISNDIDMICVDPCPAGKHRMRNGTCTQVPRCAKGTGLKAIYEDGEDTILSFTCQTIMKDTYYYYFDGVRYISEDMCETLWEGSMECKIIDCPEGYYYLHGACTKQCENATEKVCIDIVEKTNLFKKDKHGNLRAIQADSCSAPNESFVAYAVGGSVVFHCIVNVTASQALILNQTGTAVSLSSGFRCAVQMNQTYKGRIFASELCADPERIHIFTNIESNTANPLKIAVLALTINSQNKSFVYRQDADYDMFEASGACRVATPDGKFCYRRCNDGEIFHNGQCVQVVVPQANDYYIMQDGVKHKITSTADCSSFVNGLECVPFRCPTIVEIEDGIVTSTRYFYYEGMCTAGCVLDGSSNCQKYELGNIYDPSTYSARNASQCQTLVMTKTGNTISFSCSQSSTCPTGLARLENGFCVIDSQIQQTNQVYYYDTAEMPTTITATSVMNPRDCQVYNSSTAIVNGATRTYNRCLKNYKDLPECQALEYNSQLRKFRCAPTSSMSNYLSQGIYFPTCDSQTQYLVEGACVNVSSDCQLYKTNGECYTEGEIERVPKSRSGDKYFALTNYLPNETYEVLDLNTEYQGIVCPSQTHYYFRNACFKRCAIDTSQSYRCQDNPHCTMFNYTLECDKDGSSMSSTSYIGIVDFSHDVIVKEIMATNTRCDSSQVSLGRYCIQKSFVERQITNLDTCTLSIGEDEDLDEKNLNDYCTSDIIECNSYVEVELSGDKKIRICGDKTEQFDCSQGFYQFNDQFQRFKCVTQCDIGLQISGRFCFTSCTSNMTLVFNGCQPLADCEDCVNYTMSRGLKYALIPSAKAYSLAGDASSPSVGSGEHAYFACPKGFYYLENSCQEVCPHMTVNTTMGEQTHTLTVCNKSCISFSQDGECLAECPSFFHHKLHYIRPYVHYICEDNPCLTSEFTLQSEDSGNVPPLCLPKTVSSEYDAIPINKVFKYNIYAKYWEDLFVGNGDCSTYFVSPLDAKLPICADVKADKPSSIVDTLQYNYDYGMFQYRTCSFGYHVIDDACYENQLPGYSYVLNDKILKNYDPSVQLNGRHKIDPLVDGSATGTADYYRQGNCGILQYMNPETNSCTDLPRYELKSNDTNESREANESQTCQFLYTKAAYNTTQGLADEAIYFLVNDALEGIYDMRVASDSCQVASTKCPSQLGLHYFDNTCVRRCAVNLNDSTTLISNKTCLEFATRGPQNQIVYNNILLYNEDDDVPYYTRSESTPDDGALVTVAAMLGQYVVHIEGAPPVDDQSFISLQYGLHIEQIPLELTTNLPKDTCTFGINYKAIVLKDICVYNCSIFDLFEGRMLCIEAIDQLTSSSDSVAACVRLAYVPRVNMYMCTDEGTSGCNGTTILCNEVCLGGQIMFPYGACSSPSCQGDLMDSSTGTGCTRIKANSGQCLGMYVQRQSYNREVVNCPPADFDQATCECSALMPCVQGSTRFGLDCRDRTTCDHVVIVSEVEWHCEEKCPQSSVLIGNLCNSDTKGEKYLVVKEDEYKMLPWYIAMGGFGALCVLALVMVAFAVIQFRKANANKALRKSKKDTKAGYHERLSRLAADGKQQAKSQRAREDLKQAQKDKAHAAPTARRIQ